MTYTYPTRWVDPGDRSRGADRQDIADAVFAEMTPYTPTLTNLTVGTGGSLTYRYKITGKLLEARFKFKYGAGSAVGNSPIISLPGTLHGSYVAGEDVVSVTGLALDSGTTTREALARVVSSTTVEIFTFSTTGAHATINSTTPWTWTTNDVISLWLKAELV